MLAVTAREIQIQIVTRKLALIYNSLHMSNQLWEGFMPEHTMRNVGMPTVVWGVIYVHCRLMRP